LPPVGGLLARPGGGVPRRARRRAQGAGIRRLRQVRDAAQAAVLRAFLRRRALGGGAHLDLAPRRDGRDADARRGGGRLLLHPRRGPGQGDEERQAPQPAALRRALRRDGLPLQERAHARRRRQRGARGGHHLGADREARAGLRRLPPQLRPRLHGYPGRAARHGEPAPLRRLATRHFVKTGRAEALAAEVEGLAALAAAGARTPRVISLVGTTLTLERLELGAPPDWQAMGRMLAALHRHTSDRFGWGTDNWIGLAPQKNGWSTDWAAFFLEKRLRPQAARAGIELPDVKALLAHHKP